MARRRVSQREALRNRRDLRRLRSLLTDMRNKYSGEHVADIDITHEQKGLLRGVELVGGVVVVGRVEYGALRLSMLRIPRDA